MRPAAAIRILPESGEAPNGGDRGYIDLHFERLGTGLECHHGDCRSRDEMQLNFGANCKLTGWRGWDNFY